MLIPRGDVGCGSVVTLLFHLHLRTGFYFLAAVSVTFWGCLVCVQMQPVLIWQSTWLHGCGADHARQRAKKTPSQKHIPERLDIRGLTSEWLSRLRPSSGFCCHPSTFLLCFRPKPFDRVLPQRGNFQHGNQALQQCSRGGHRSAVEQPAFFMFQSKDSFSNILTSAVETQTVTVCI